jgi:hypothetical protein
VIFAFIFAALVSPAWSGGEFALAGTAFGLCLWVVNFYGIASVAGWSWFPQRSNPIMQVVAHAFFFGCPLGWLLARSRLTLAV